MDRGAKIQALQAKLEAFYPRLRACDLCPRKCLVDRTKGKTGFCGVTDALKVYTAFCHRGEEPGISGSAGSGTIFFSGCNLKCVFCQNHKFSHTTQGRTIRAVDLARIMMNLQKKGSHNINLVTPTHYLPQIVEAVILALQQGLTLPIVYNTSGYELAAVIEQISELVDVYLPDMKYMAGDSALKFSCAQDYITHNKAALKEMHRQKSAFTQTPEGLVTEGLIVRHLVLPGHSAESLEVLTWIKRNLPGAAVSVMLQFQPYHKAKDYLELQRLVSAEEYERGKAHVEALGLEGWVQELKPAEELAGVHFQDQLDEFLST
jgi:putative pyruvate formate lyase activating enzyme